MKMRFTALSVALLLSSVAFAAQQEATKPVVAEVKKAEIKTSLVAETKSEEKTETKNPKKSNLSNFLDSDVKTDLVIRVFDRFESVRDSETGKQENKLLEEKRNDLTVGVQKEEQAYVQAATEFKKKASVMNDAAREVEQNKLVKLERNYKTKVQESDEEFKRAMNKASERLFKEVQEAVAEVAQEEKVDLMIDAATGQVVYASERAQVTNKITNRMNKLALKKKSEKKAASLTV